MSVIAKPPGQSLTPRALEPISFEAFLDWMDEDTPAEWVDGEIVMTSPASAEHQDIRDFLLNVMALYVEGRQLGKLISAPFLIHLPARPSGREPDLSFIKTEHLDRLQPTYFAGPPDLVVEIISPESDARDRGDKFVEYEASGVPEYWLIDPLRRQITFYRIGPEGRYQVAPMERDTFHSAALSGFWLKPEWLWQRPLPSVAWTAAQIGGMEHARTMVAALRGSLSADELRALVDERERGRTSE